MKCKWPKNRFHSAPRNLVQNQNHIKRSKIRLNLEHTFLLNAPRPPKLRQIDDIDEFGMTLILVLQFYCNQNFAYSSSRSNLSSWVGTHLSTYLRLYLADERNNICAETRTETIPISYRVQLVFPIYFLFMRHVLLVSVVNRWALRTLEHVSSLNLSSSSNPWFSPSRCLWVRDQRHHHSRTHHILVPANVTWTTI